VLGHHVHRTWHPQTFLPVGRPGVQIVNHSPLCMQQVTARFTEEIGTINGALRCLATMFTELDTSDLSSCRATWSLECEPLAPVHAASDSPSYGGNWNKWRCFPAASFADLRQGNASSGMGVIWDKKPERSGVWITKSSHYVSWDPGYPQNCFWRFRSSGMLRRVVWCDWLQTFLKSVFETSRRIKKITQGPIRP
jgi:hypothetical protein